MDVLYSYVERLQDTKADKENVASEMNVKADKEALDSKVSVATFDNTFTLLDEGLKEALHKMDDYMNEELALKQALRQLSLDMSEKMDGQAFQALQQYLGERAVAVVYDFISRAKPHSQRRTGRVGVVAGTWRGEELGVGAVGASLLPLPPLLGNFVHTWFSIGSYTLQTTKRSQKRDICNVSNTFEAVEGTQFSNF